MLVEFRVENFRSFKGEQVLSMVASGSDKTLEDNCMDAGKLTLVRGAAVYGANASGKSNLVEALDVMQNWIINSASQDTEKRRRLVPFLLDENCSKETTSFEATFVHEKVRYQYGFSVLGNRVLKEWLFAFPKGSPQMWYERSSDPKKEESTFSFGSYLKGEKTKLKERTRDDSLLLSVAAQWNNKQLLTVFSWFDLFLRVITTKDRLGPVTAMALTSPEAGDPEKLRSFVLGILQDADIGIYDLKVLKHDPEKVASGLPENTAPDVRERYLRHLRDNPFYQTMTVHREVATGRPVVFDMEDESDGTRELFELAIPWLQALKYGFTVVYDEIERSLHSMLVRELVKPFFNSEMNESGAQLILTTHDTTMLDPELFRRDQIWFTEKDEEGATQLIPLSDYKPRPGEALRKGYLSGRYGAVPILKAFSIHDSEAKIEREL
jgi:AAA15 family ATPase/GTPase